MQVVVSCSPINLHSESSENQSTQFSCNVPKAPDINQRRVIQSSDHCNRCDEKELNIPFSPAHSTFSGTSNPVSIASSSPVNYTRFQDQPDLLMENGAWGAVEDPQGVGVNSRNQRNQHCDLTQENSSLEIKQSALCCVSVESDHWDPNSHMTRPIELNVGGEIFVVGPQSISHSLLLSSIFQASSGRRTSQSLVKDASGRFFIDRDASEFGELLQYLRTGELPLTSKDCQSVAIQLRRHRKSFGFYGVPFPSLCSNCSYLYNPDLNEPDSCTCHPGRLIQTGGRQMYSCCWLPAEGLGCRITAHEALQPRSFPSATVAKEDIETSQVESPNNYIWRISPEEGSRVPLVVEMGIQRKGSRHILQLDSTMTLPLSTKPPAAELEEFPAKPLRKQLVSEETMSPRLRPPTLVFESPLSQSSSITSSETNPFQTEADATALVESNHPVEPYDLVCRQADYSVVSQSAEIVNLICDVDIEGVDFSCSELSDNCPEDARPSSTDSGDTQGGLSSKDSFSSSLETTKKSEQAFSNDIYDAKKLLCLPSSPEGCAHPINDRRQTCQRQAEVQSTCNEKKKDLEELDVQEPSRIVDRPSSEQSEALLEKLDQNRPNLDDRYRTRMDIEESSFGPCWLYEIQKAECGNNKNMKSSKNSDQQKRRCEYFKNMKCSIGGRCQYLHEESPQESSAIAQSTIEESGGEEGDKKKLILLGVRNRCSNQNNSRYKTRMCPLFRSGGCPRTSTDCKFAHGLEDLRGTPEYFKTQICVFWSAGHCRAGSHCRHAHGINELRGMEVKTDRVPQTLTVCKQQAKDQNSITETIDVNETQLSNRAFAALPVDYSVEPRDPPINTLSSSRIASLYPTRVGFGSRSFNTPVAPPIFGPISPTQGTTIPTVASPPNCRIIWFQVGQPTHTSMTYPSPSTEPQAIYLQNGSLQQNSWATQSFVTPLGSESISSPCQVYQPFSVVPPN